jgi:hypothetical protein
MWLDKVISISDSDLEWNGIGDDEGMTIIKRSSIGG